MADQRDHASMAAVALLLGALAAFFPIYVDAIGVCYGMDGDNLPQPSSVVSLYESNGISAMRLYAPNDDALQALGGSNIQLILGVDNQDLQSLASSASAASSWVQTNVQAYPSVSFKYIAVGNEVPDSDTGYILPAMKNIFNALSSAGLQSQIKVSTAVSYSVMGVSYPPSSGSFTSSAQSYLEPILQFLSSNGAPLMANVYTYFSYVGNPSSIDINYALFTSSGTVVSDPPYSYQNLFDAMVDALYVAMGNAGGSSVGLVVSESGWPSAGGTATTVDNAQTYNQNLINHVGQGTPRKPGSLETYVFSMFNEDQKPQGIEQNWGLFYPNEQPVYAITF